jgi:hypothetical protein
LVAVDEACWAVTGFVKVSTTSAAHIVDADFGM